MLYDVCCVLCEFSVQTDPQLIELFSPCFFYFYFLFFKRHSSSSDNRLFDSVRGSTHLLDQAWLSFLEKQGQQSSCRKAHLCTGCFQTHTPSQPTSNTPCAVSHALTFISVRAHLKSFLVQFQENTIQGTDVRV